MSLRAKKPTYHKSVSGGIPLDTPFSEPRRVSTLLVPPNLVRYVKKRGVAFLLEKTLESQHGILKTAKRINNSSPNTMYQKVLRKKSEEYYVKMNFRPKPSLWAQLRSLAIANGISMCYLFIILLEAYMAAQAVGKQKILWQMKATIYVNLEKRVLFRELWMTEYEITNSPTRKNSRADGSSDPKIA